MVFTNANKHSYQLQNDSRSAPKVPTSPAGRLPSSRHPHDAISPSARPPSAILLNFWSPASPCNLEEDRGSVSFHVPTSPRQTPQIFDTQNPMKKKTAKLRSVRITRRRSCEIESQRSGCGKLMWKSEGDRRRIRRARLGAGAIRRK